MKKLGLIGLAAAFVLIASVGMSYAVGKKHVVCYPSKSEVSLRIAMRSLWDDHNAWTRMYIESAVSGLPDTDKVAARLLKNQEDIGNAIKPFYGKDAGDKLTALLKEHIKIAGGLVMASKAGDTKKAADFEKKWDANADEIVAFLNKANPKFWPKDELKSMMSAHLATTKQMATATIGKDYSGVISAYDRSREHVLMMADTLSEGIVKQFPKKFKGICV